MSKPHKAPPPPLTGIAKPQIQLKQHGLKLPLYATIHKEIQGLVQHLISELQTCEFAAEPSDEQKVEATFCWIATNLTYDVETYATGRLLDSRHDAGACAYHTRTALCSGYAHLFQKMCSFAGIECARIVGFSKGGCYAPGDVVGDTVNHEWNAVRICGKWRLVDVTWGSGYITQKGVFVKEYRPYYLFPDPAELIHTHFPSNVRWQLLRRPFSITHFEQETHFHSGFFEHQIISCDQPMGLIMGHMELTVIKLSCYCPMLYTYYLWDPRRGTSFNSCVKYNIQGNVVTFVVVPPYWASFHFTIYGKVNGSSKKSSALVSFSIVSSDVENLPTIFPGEDILWGVTSHYESLGLVIPDIFSSYFEVAEEACEVSFAISHTATLECAASLQCLSEDCSCDIKLEGNEKRTEFTVENIETHTCSTCASLEELPDLDAASSTKQHSLNVCSLNLAHKGHFKLSVFARSNLTDPMLCICRHWIYYK